MTKALFNILILTSLSCMLTRDLQLLTYVSPDRMEYCENNEEENTFESDPKNPEKKEKDSEQQENSLWSFQYRLAIFDFISAFQNRIKFAERSQFWGQPYLAVFSPPPDSEQYFVYLV